MLRRARRPLALAASVVLLSGLAACGSDDGDGEAEGLDAVAVSGDVGSAPEIEWEGEMNAGEVVSETLVEGDGAELEDGDSVLVNYWVGNGFTEEEALSSFGEKMAGSVITIGEPKQVQQIGDIVPAFIAEQVEAGATVGTRLAFAGDAPKVFGDNAAYLAEFKIGNEDPVVVVADLVGIPLESPEGKQQPAPDWAPQIVEKKGVPTSLDFSGTPAPNKRLRTAVLIEGEGEKVAKGDVLVADYLGQVYQGKQPFDESFSGEQPASFPIGLGFVVKGWDKALVGVPVGSRVMLQIPPELGYGKQGQPQAGIKGTDTLYFVVDVLGAA